MEKTPKNEKDKNGKKKKEEHGPVMLSRLLGKNASGS
jgi:hypothetical protein